MRPFVRRTIQVAAVAGGFWLLGAGVANADDPLGGQGETSESTSQTNASASVCDNHVPGAGTHECVSTEDSGSSAGQTNDSEPAPQPQPAPEAPEPATSGSSQPEVSEPLPAPGAGDSPEPAAQPAPQPSNDEGTTERDATTQQQQQDPGSDNPVNPTVNVPIEICGNAVAVLEDASQECSPQGEDSTPPDNEADGEGGFLAGNQINPVINAPIMVCGNAVGVLAGAEAQCEPSNQGPSASPGNTTTGDDGVLSGNQINPVVNAPITTCGNGIGVIGATSADCTPTGQGIASPGDNTTSGDDGVLSGNQINPLVNAPVTVCGNSVNVLGEGTAGCEPTGQGLGSGTGSGTGDNTTSGEDAPLLSGNQVNPIANLPVTVCGNAIGVGADTTAVCEPSDQGTGTGDGSGTGDNTTSGDGGNLSGNIVDPIVNAPVTVCGNAVGGDATAICKPSDQGTGGDSGTGDTDTSGTDGNGSGNVIAPDVNAPVTVCGNAVAVAGDATAICENGNGQGIAPPGNGDGDDGNSSGPGSGNEVTPDVNAPVDVCGNAAGVAGEATAECIQGGGPTPPGPPGPPEGPPEGPDAPDEPGAPTGPGAPAGPGAAAATSGLPTTGTDAAGLALMGLLFMLAGATLVGYGRRRATAVG